MGLSLPITGSPQKEPEAPAFPPCRRGFFLGVSLKAGPSQLIRIKAQGAPHSEVSGGGLRLMPDRDRHYPRICPVCRHAMVREKSALDPDMDESETSRCLNCGTVIAYGWQVPSSNEDERA